MLYTGAIASTWIEEAIDNEEFVLYYQPQSSLYSGKIVGIEALVRWHSRILGNVHTAHFINVLENSEMPLIAKFYEWILRAVFKQIVAWQKMGISIPIYINFPPFFLQQCECSSPIRSLIQEFNILPSWFGVEVSESFPIKDMRKTKLILDNFYKMGVEIVLDNFCTGYCSLEYLSDLPATKIKIDKSFVYRLVDRTSSEPSNRSAIILESIIEMAMNLDIKIVAEGVETVNQLEQVTLMGFDAYQGYFFCPPVLPDKITKMIESETSRLYSLCLHGLDSIWTPAVANGSINHD